MFHKAVELNFVDNTIVEVKFQNGVVKQYDMSTLFDKYPQLQALKDRDLFLSGRLSGFYGIIWNDALDIETETIYESGYTVRIEGPAPTVMAGDAVQAARAEKGISQVELSKLTGIDQADISRIERGVANPSVTTLNRIAEALGGRLDISINL